MKTPAILSIIFCLILFLSCKNNTVSEKNENTPQEIKIKTNDTILSEKDTILTISAEETEQEPESIDLRVYLSDPDVEGVTNLRSEPNGEILGELEHDYEYIIYLDAQLNGWFRIASVEGIGIEIDVPKSELWIHYSVVGVSSRNYGNQTLNLYSLPNSESEICGKIIYETSLKVTKVQGDFAYVFFIDENNKKISGWIETTWLCGNPVTNCC